MASHRLTKEERLKGQMKTTKSGDKAVKMGHEGGIASGIAKRHAKSIRAALQIIHETEYTQADDSVLTGGEESAVALHNKAKDGDVAAIKLEAELMEEYEQKVNISGADDKPFLKIVDGRKH